MEKSNLPDDRKKQIKRDRLQRALKEIVEYHCDIINLAEHFEELVNGAILVDFIGASIIICVSFFYIIIVRTITITV